MYITNICRVANLSVFSLFLDFLYLILFDPMRLSLNYTPCNIFFFWLETLFKLIEITFISDFKIGCNQN